MGSFMGHLLPGMFFILFGIWFSLKYPYRHFVSKRKTSKRRCCFCDIDIVEGCAKIICPAIGIIMEQFTNNGPAFHLTNSSDQYWDGNNWSHCTMYLFFIFAGIADICVIKFPLSTPRGTEHFAMGLAILIEGFLFYFHTHGRADLDVRIHVLLLLAIWVGGGALMILCVLEALTSKDETTGKQNQGTNLNNTEYLQLLDTDATSEMTVLEDIDVQDFHLNPEQDTNGITKHKLTPQLIALATMLKEDLNTAVKSQKCDKSNLRIILQMVAVASILLQGTWFCQIATILYPPGREGWDTDAHTNVEFATIFFSWHLASVAVYVCAVYMVTGLLTSRKRQKNIEI